jgi:hypothetical protein|nr:MAG TPA: hypothetical protein [Bacteriophage sp.]
MFILTQHRAEIVDTSKCFGICIVDDTTVIRAYCNDTSNWIMLGFYKTRERAKEVIQEINVALCENRVSFDMPED